MYEVGDEYEQVVAINVKLNNLIYYILLSNSKVSCGLAELFRLPSNYYIKNLEDFNIFIKNLVTELNDINEDGDLELYPLSSIIMSNNLVSSTNFWTFFKENIPHTLYSCYNNNSNNDIEHIIFLFEDLKKYAEQ